MSEAPDKADVVLRCINHALRETTGDLTIRVPAHWLGPMRSVLGPSCEVVISGGRRLTFRARAFDDGEPDNCFFVNGHPRFLQ